MDQLTGAELTLRTTPTAGVSGEHSPYYRRLLSAGYKGFLQGTIGGISLYGLIGGLIGLCAVPLVGPWLMASHIAGLTWTSVWSIVPILTGVGMAKGASTFGNIGAVAAINAEGAETSEKRRYLLDRYYALPNDPAYDAEASQIRKLLAVQNDTRVPEGIIHWKTAITGMVLGAIACAAIVYFAPIALLSAIHLTPILAALHVLPGTAAALSGAAAESLTIATASTAGVAAVHAWAAVGVGAAIGGVAGTAIGIDRFYVRRWFDFSESLLNDPKGVRQEMAEREVELNKLEQVSPNKGAPLQTVKLEIREPNRLAQNPVQPEGGQPGTQIHTVNLDAGRLSDPSIARSPQQ